MIIILVIKFTLNNKIKIMKNCNKHKKCNNSKIKIIILIKFSLRDKRLLRRLLKKMILKMTLKKKRKKKKEQFLRLTFNLYKIKKLYMTL